MDEFLTGHLERWLEAHTLDDGERDRVRELMTAFVCKHPRAVDTRGWTEIRRLAERVL